MITPVGCRAGEAAGPALCIVWAVHPADSPGNTGHLQHNTFLGADTLNNPSNNIAFAAAGRGKLSVHITRIVSSRTLHLVPCVQNRFPEQLHKDAGAVVYRCRQVVGGLLGAYAAIQYIPPSWQTDFAALSSGVKPGVSLWAGSACEAILAFLLNMAILYSLSELFVFLLGG